MQPVAQEPADFLELYTHHAHKHLPLATFQRIFQVKTTPTPLRTNFIPAKSAAIIRV
jgi:hypothetical protein